MMFKELRPKPDVQAHLLSAQMDASKFHSECGVVVALRI
jgi:hypothetical protein